MQYIVYREPQNPGLEGPKPPSIGPILAPHKSYMSVKQAYENNANYSFQHKMLLYQNWIRLFGPTHPVAYFSDIKITQITLN